MADSEITKMALANTLKRLLEDQPLEKISVSDISSGCNMSRKSFYYHFRDKYDLVNWIFDSERPAIRIGDPEEPDLNPDDFWTNVAHICQYFFDNRSFYCRVLKVDGQNSFSSHFREFIRPLLRLRVEDLKEQEDVPPMVYDFLVDGVICAIARWLMDKNCVSVEEFVHNLKKLHKLLFVGLNQRYSADPQWLE